MRELAVVAGRWQEELSAADSARFDGLFMQYSQIAVIVEVERLALSAESPLPFPLRSEMLRDSHSQLTVIAVASQRTIVEWTSACAAAIRAAFPRQCLEAVFFQNDCCTVTHGDAKSFSTLPSGTAYGKMPSNRVSEARREGARLAAESRFIQVLPVVDAILIDFKQERALLGRKAGRDKFCFIGGFVDAADESLEAAARRETRQEAGMHGLAIGKCAFVGSARIEDWRLRPHSQVSLMSSLFVIEYLSGAAIASDDIEEVRWFSIGEGEQLPIAQMVPQHQPLAMLLKRRWPAIKKQFGE